MVLKRKKEPVPIVATDEQLQDIMENFDFELVHNYMERGHKDGEPWKIYVNGKYKVPDVQELKDFARRQLEDVIERYNNGTNYGYVHCGPFKAICRYGILELECIIENWSCD